ncbi:MAG: hypothetical protein LBH43_07965 [Treponema sp.]|jgi:hypothetical protein|nr:hypothetical protein [Treponema sp.]
MVSNITLKNSVEPDSYICQFMRLVDDFFKTNTPYKTLGYKELPTKTDNAILIGVYIAKKEYKPEEEKYACFLEPEYEG